MVTHTIGMRIIRNGTGKITEKIKAKPSFTPGLGYETYRCDDLQHSPSGCHGELVQLFHAA